MLLRTATKALEVAKQTRQASWTTVSHHVLAGNIKPGIYRLAQGPGLWAEAVVIERFHDYPELFEMYR